jgi:hypothetical protein
MAMDTINRAGALVITHLKFTEKAQEDKANPKKTETIW